MPVGLNLFDEENALSFRVRPFIKSYMRDDVGFVKVERTKVLFFWTTRCFFHSINQFVVVLESLVYLAIVRHAVGACLAYAAAAFPSLPVLGGNVSSSSR